VDRFAGPLSSREEFLSRVQQTHALLRRQPGLVRDLVLESQPDDATFKVVTLVEWESATLMSQAREVVAAFHRSSGFQPAELFARLGISAELGIYAPVGAAPPSGISGASAPRLDTGRPFR
jgi:heme-degrading monooxygenase HmoA